MFRHLLTSAALAALVVGSAHAAGTSTTATGGVTTGEIMFYSDASAFNDASMHAFLASSLIGETVYKNEGDGSEAVGDINDLIVAQDGSIDAVVIGVGGFLGVGEKNVAINFDSLQWRMPTPDEDAKLVLTVTNEQLEAAPNFDTAALQDDMMRANGAMNDTTPAVQDQTAAQMSTDQPAVDMRPAEDMAAAMPSSEGLSDVDVTTVSANDLISTTVYSAENENVGEVADVLVNEDGTIDAVVLDIGGFLGIGEKPVAIGFEELTIRRDEGGALYVYTGFTRAQLEGAPDYDADRYLDDRAMMRLHTSG